jgi:hypothetical protein
MSISPKPLSESNRRCDVLSFSGLVPLGPDSQDTTGSESFPLDKRRVQPSAAAKPLAVKKAKAQGVAATGQGANQNQGTGARPQIQPDAIRKDSKRDKPQGSGRGTPVPAPVSLAVLLDADACSSSSAGEGGKQLQDRVLSDRTGRVNQGPLYPRDILMGPDADGRKLDSSRATKSHSD